jgi:hypothetical protein
MSFLSRRPSRSGSREGDAGRDDEYDDYDYAPDAYRGDEDENWSPGEYFSPEGIKGRRAGGQRPVDRADPRGRRGDAGRGDSGQGYEDRTAGAGYDDDGYDAYGPGGYSGGGYGTDEYATGAYDLPEGADGERGGRRRKERGERGGRLRLRRDRGEDIWPDDGVSDEDYWASVASDRPLNAGNLPLEADPLTAADSRPMGRPGGRGNNDDVRVAAGPRPAADSRTGSDQRFADEQRGVTGRLGPPPGLLGDYQPGGGVNSGRAGSGPLGGSRPNPGASAGRAASGPMAGFAPSGGGPTSARPGTGPMSVRPGTGPSSAWSSQAGFGQPGTGPQPSFQPGGGPARSRPQDGRQPDRADWGERTERIDRVNASGYPEPRGNGRGQGPGRADNGRADNGRADNGRPDNGRPDSADWRTRDRREPVRDADREPGRGTGGWPVTARGGLAVGDRSGADDPLTSTAYSRASASDSDGRSYRVAARRSQAQAKLTEQTQTFSAPGGYPSDQHRTGPYDTGLTGGYSTRPGQYQTGATGEYPTVQHRASGVTGVTGKSAADQYRTGEYGQYRADAQQPAARYPGYSGQGGQPVQSAKPGSNSGPAQPVQPSRRGQPGPAGPGGSSGSSRPSGSGGSSAPSGGQPVGNSGRVSLPNGTGAPSRQYPAQPAWHPEQRPQSPPPRQPAQPHVPAVGSQSAGSHGGGSPATSASGRSMPGATGRNPYDSAVTGSYPYPVQPYPSRPGPTANPPSGADPALNGRDVRDGRDDRYYRPGSPPSDGYGPGNADYGTPRDGRY